MTGQIKILFIYWFIDCLLLYQQKHGTNIPQTLTSSLILLYAKCDAIDQAQQVSLLLFFCFFLFYFDHTSYLRNIQLVSLVML